MINNIINSGVSATRKSYEENLTIRLTNKISLFVIFNAFIFAIISYLFFPILLLNPLQSIIIYTLIIILNGLDYTKTAKTLCSIFCTIMISILHASLVKDNETMLYQFFITQLGLCLFPLIVFNSQEKVLTILTTIFCIALPFSQGYINQHINAIVDTEMIREGFQGVYTYFSSILLIIICIYTIVIKHKTLNKNRKEK